MGHKRVCIACRITRNIQVEDLDPKLTHPCGRCRQPMIFLLSHFRPPKKSDDAAWEVVAFLVSNGFRYQHIYQEGLTAFKRRSKDNYIPYPKNLRDAKEFVTQYKHKLSDSKPITAADQ